jgi:DNA-directed RNA polymerase beta subunit
MTRMAMDVALGITPKSDRDHFRFKRLDASGDLCFQEFRRIFKDVAGRMLKDMDTRVHFEEKTYEGAKLSKLVQEENIGYYWKSYTFMNEFEKSFKSTWGGKNGVSQELSRLAYLGSVAHLRRVNLDMDRNSKVIDARRIHSSTWGLMCPVDNPDGRNIGMVKSMTLLCTLSTSTPAAKIDAFFAAVPAFIPVHLIHPVRWDPIWTKVFINSNLVGVLGSGAESVYAALARERRSLVHQRR